MVTFTLYHLERTPLSTIWFSGDKIEMSWAGHVARMGERRGVYRVTVGKPEGKRPGVDGRIILRWIFRKWDVGAWTGSSWLRIGTGGGQM